MSIPVYLNPMQREVLAIGAHDNVIVAGRGTGKSVLHASILLNVFQTMPASTTAIVAPNAIRALSNTIPSLTTHWETWGYRQGIHWCIGRRPPSRLRWPAPLIPPHNWENVISFYTGAIAVIISQDRRGTSNSKSFDFVDIDEAKFIKYERLKEETFLANRGQQREFGNNPLHHGMLITSDMPLTKSGSWFLNYKDSATPDHIAAILTRRQQICEIRRRTAQDPSAPAYLHRRIKEYTTDLSRLRANAFHYGTYSSLINIEVLGESYIRRMRRELPPLVFLTSVLSIAPRLLQDGFYSSMSERNLYTAADFNYLDTLPPGAAPPLDSRCDADIIPGEPLCIAFDFNRNINWLVVGQVDRHHGRMNTLRAFFVKYERKLPELVDDFAQYYRQLANKDIVFYYDSTAIGSNYAVSDIDFHKVIIDRLQKHRYNVTPVYIGRPMNHAQKHLLINQGFKGQGRLTPYINEENCKDLLVSLQMAGVYNGKKDKRGEKYAETEEDRLETRTDGSDAWDTLYIGCECYPTTAAPLHIHTSNWS